MKNTPIADLHIHTNFSPDSSVPMRSYAELAVERNVKILCFTDHVDCIGGFKNFSKQNLYDRRVEFEKVKKEFGGSVKLLLGVEFGEPNLCKDEFEFVQSLSLDMIIASVHSTLDKCLFMDDYCRRQCERDYNQAVFEMVEHGGFDVLGHIDMPKRYHHDYVEDGETIKKTLSLCAKKGIVPEINTSTLRRGFSETMPSLKMIEFYKQCGGKFVTINSDSHRLLDLATDFKNVFQQLPSGIKCCYFEQRKLVELD